MALPSRVGGAYPHRFLGALTLMVVVAHMGAPVADSFVHFGAADLLVPGSSAWKTVPVAVGIVSFWLLALVEVTSLVKKRLPNKVWVRIHLLSFVAYVLATLHYLQAGTERSNPVVLISVEVVLPLPPPCCSSRWCGSWPHGAPVPACCCGAARPQAATRTPRTPRAA